MIIPKGSPMGSPKVSSKGNLTSSKGVDSHVQPKASYPKQNPPETLSRVHYTCHEMEERGVPMEEFRNEGGSNPRDPNGNQEGEVMRAKSGPWCEPSEQFTSHGNTITVVFGGLLSYPNIDSRCFGKIVW